jgi:hypothetical protein
MVCAETANSLASLSIVANPLASICLTIIPCRSFVKSLSFLITLNVATIVDERYLTFMFNY